MPGDEVAFENLSGHADRATKRARDAWRRVAIVGGGPGGLMTAYLLERAAPGRCEITLYEADDRLGGKIVGGRFRAAPVAYEAGVAELYDYSQLGSDPLRALVGEFGLPVRHISGNAMVMDDQILKSPADICRCLGSAAERALRRFRSAARKAVSPVEYYESGWESDSADRLAQQSFRDVLAKIGNAQARRYIEISVHSDLATEPHLTNAKYGLHNYLMNEPDYMRLYTIDGGIERLPRALAARVEAEVRLRSRVTHIERLPGGPYRVSSRRGGRIASEDFDYAILALPNNWLPLIEWGGPVLAEAMHRHHQFYDYPAHYLRVSILFSRPFWREQISGSYFISEAFGGCCVYDESPPTEAGGFGVLGWLLAGEAAMAMSSLDDPALVAAVLDSLPAPLRHGHELSLEGRVHRWVGTVNGLPGGVPARDPQLRHRPEPTQHPGLFVVGDYLFDSTINGILDSAELVVQQVAEELARQAPAPMAHPAPAAIK